MLRRAWLLALAPLAACGHGDAVSRSPARLGMEGVVVRGSPDSLTGLSTYDADTLFHYALEADRAGRFEDARTLYLRLLDELPDSRLAVAARYNLGLMHERVAAYTKAAELYDAITKMPVPVDGADRRTWLDAGFRLAACAGRVGDWWRVYGVFDELLALDWLEDGDRMQALVGSGIALDEAGEPQSADAALSQALLFYGRASREHRFDDRGLAAQAAFRLGEIARAEFETVELAFPQEVLEQRLERKCDLLLSAQGRYLRAMRYGDAQTVAAAGLRIGELYESLYDMMVSLSAPPELTLEQAEAYHEEVHARLRVLVRKALTAYERSLAVGKRAPAAAAWVARLEAAAERLRAVYLAEEEAP